MPTIYMGDNGQEIDISASGRQAESRYIIRPFGRAYRVGFYFGAKRRFVQVGEECASRARASQLRREILRDELNAISEI